MASKPCAHLTFWNINGGFILKSGWGRRCFSCNSSHNVLPIRCSLSSARNLQKFDQGGHSRILPLIFVARAEGFACQKWPTHLRWLLEFSSKWQKEKRDASPWLPLPLHQTLLPPPTHLPRRCLWGRWRREKQVIRIEHSETNQWSRKWVINIKIPSLDAKRNWDSRCEAPRNNTQLGCGRECFTFYQKKLISMIMIFSILIFFPTDLKWVGKFVFILIVPLKWPSDCS